MKKSIIKFIIPSLIGIFLFITPISLNGSITIPIAVLSNLIQSLLSKSIGLILVFLITLSFIASFITTYFKPKFITNHIFLRELFDVSFFTLIIRFFAFLFSLISLFTPNLESLPAFFKPFIEMIASNDTGSLVAHDLLPVLFSIFLLAGLFLPLLLNFGLLEFVGSLLIKVMRPVFNLPGRSAIDCIASWLGDGTIGVLLTSKQYEEGFYTQREACVIGTTFSLVSVTFSLVVINTVGLGHLFVPFYLTVCISSLICAIILPKLPPLSKKPDLLIDGTAPKLTNAPTHGYFKEGLTRAIEKASKQSYKKSFLIEGSKNVLDMWLAVIPMVMTVGTFALILATYTPIFKFLGMPFTPFLNLLHIPEAAAASQTLIAGFADMLLPSIMASSIKSPLTRFVIASVSVSQLIYLSEVGTLLLGSKIPLRLNELFIIFIERTLLVLPIVALIAHIIF